MESQVLLYQIYETEKQVSLAKLNNEDFSSLDFFMSKAFTQGESLFTSTLVEKGKPWFLEDHLERLANSCQFYFAFSKQQLFNFKADIIKEITQIPFSKSSSYLRLTCFESMGKKFLAVIVKPHVDPRNILQTIKLISLKSNHQLPERRLHKWGNYLEANLSKKKLPSDTDLLYLNKQDKVLELSSSNIFFSDGKDYFTPSLNSEILDGVYRKNLIKHLEKSKMTILEESISIMDAKQFKFAFATNCLSGIRVIHSIDDHIYEFNGQNSIKFFKEVLY